MHKDVLGKAMYDHYHKLSRAGLWIYNKYGMPESMNVAMYFRQVADMPEIERVALQHCTGTVLDIGAGAGSHALALQQQGLQVTAIDISENAVRLMKKRGVKHAEVANVFTWNKSRYDTLLMMMNGIGLAESVDGLHTFFMHAKTLLQPGGQLLFDSCDVAYLYEQNGTAMPAGYYGEIAYQYRYRQQRTQWFTWLYIDKHTMTKVAETAGFSVKILHEDEYDQYLARLTTN